VKRAILALSVIGLLTLAPSAQGKRPIMLLFHAGAFTMGSPADMAEEASAARRRGFKPRAVAYALGNLPQTIRDTKAAASRYAMRRTVVAYGESAGGGLAAMLASRGLVDAAVTYSGVNNMPAWFEGRDTLDASPGQLYRWSATSRRRSESPILAFTTRAEDPFVPTGPTRKWANGPGDHVRHQLVGGFHIASWKYEPQAHAKAVRRAMRFLRREARQVAGPTRVRRRSRARVDRSRGL
jgi:dienelactone hydrolase